MDFIADVLMVAGCIGAAVYCFVLSGRLKRFSTLESGMGGAIAVLSAQVDDMTKALDAARKVAGGSAQSLETLTHRAEATAARLEILMATMHDLPKAQTAPPFATEDDEGGDRKLRFMRRRPTRTAEAAE